jgi:hypothetical protein
VRSGTSNSSTNIKIDSTWGLNSKGASAAAYAYAYAYASATVILTSTALGG